MVNIELKLKILMIYLMENDFSTYTYNKKLKKKISLEKNIKDSSDSKSIDSLRPELLF